MTTTGVPTLEPCPSWCRNGDTHGHEVHPDDEAHWSSDEPLTLTGGQHDVAVYLAQRVGEEPLVGVVIDGLEVCVFTRAEAAAFAEMFARAARTVSA
jgi:hypothetical protein